MEGSASLVLWRHVEVQDGGVVGSALVAGCTLAFAWLKSSEGARRFWSVADREFGVDDKLKTG